MGNVTQCDNEYNPSIGLTYLLSIYYLPGTGAGAGARQRTRQTEALCQRTYNLVGRQPSEGNYMTVIRQEALSARGGHRGGSNLVSAPWKAEHGVCLEGRARRLPGRSCGATGEQKREQQVGRLGVQKERTYCK